MPLACEDYLSLREAPRQILEFADRWINDKDHDARACDVSEYEFDVIPNGSADNWLFAVIAIAKKTEDGRHDAILAAGMLEDFLAEHGEEYFETIAELSRSWPRFRHLLGGLWRGRIRKGLWHRIEAIRGQPWS